ncbi:phosphate/phosphite/phosphonate ABC transporter substrate-binding protein [Aliiroseovarius sp. YM-037]|uniref:phosphate/phosphite/phosphonate ABC transporter substrate-binding protein n=1 Tax=Aliiroseovarius sp. YM-037 TaxID=3341728 RepID=UPI003A800FE3
MIAHLGMYDRAETAAANDRLWATIRENLGYGPDHLTRNRPFMDVWRDPGLLLAQTCGYPYRAVLHDRVTLIGTPDYGLPDCAPGDYFSVFIAHKEDPRRDVSEFGGASFAFNEPMSQSGWAAPRHHADQIGIRFGALLQTGGHVRSAKAVADQKAELAAIDAVTWTMIERWDNWAKDLKIVGRTAHSPGLPLITAQPDTRDALFSTVSDAIANLTPRDRDTLSLRGIVGIPKQRYLSVPTPSAPDKSSSSTG